MSHLLARRYRLRGFSNCRGEGWGHNYSHHKLSGRLLRDVCAAEFTPGTSESATHTMPAQTRAQGLHHPHCLSAQTLPGMVLTHSSKPWAWAQLAQALTLAKDHPQLAAWMRPLCIGVKFSSTDVASTVGFMARMDPGSAYFANKDLSVCNRLGFSIWWSTSALAWHTSIFCPVQWTKYF